MSASLRSSARSSTLCRESLTQYKVPVTIAFVPSLTISESGKLARHNA